MCPDDPAKYLPGICGCHVSDVDADGDGVPDCADECPNSVFKRAPGACGCDTADTDLDADGVADCRDNCARFNPDQADADGDGIGDACAKAVEEAAPVARGCGASVAPAGLAVLLALCGTRAICRRRRMTRRRTRPDDTSMS